ncbi:hypothetical protein MTR67_002534 [Solanum verrucosum]|uniref:Uncharacterized protein n=1 Tax=Solanum verrucosum TaxID=315347 RepID=A0AAF0PQB3_SOLVR|nr:hypothetical protein MTR67_002534 [Solanum verrucosum]
MEKRMTQLDLLSKHIMEGGLKSVNAIGTNSWQCSDYSMFEALHDKQVQFLGNQLGSSNLTY